MAITVLTDASPSAPALTYAAGSIVGVFDYCLVDTLGWESPAGLRDTGIAAYRSTAANTNGYWLSVNHDDSNVYKMRGFEIMTAPDTGTGLFPTVTQASLGVYGGISDINVTTARPWLFISDGLFFWFFVRRNNVTSQFYNYMAFGDIADPYVTGDVSHCMLLGNTTSTALSAVVPAAYLARDYTKAANTSVAVQLRTLLEFGYIFGSRSTSQPYPASTNGNLFITQGWIEEKPIGHIRGRLPGYYAMVHAYGHYDELPHDSSITDVPGFPGRTFKVVRISTSGGAGTLLFDITGPWRG